MELKIRKTNEKAIEFWLDYSGKDIIVCSNPDDMVEFTIHPDKSWVKNTCGNLDNKGK